MREDKKCAAAAALIGLGYLAVAGFNFWLHRLIWGVVLLAAGWAFQTVQLFYYGRRTGMREAFEEADIVLKEARGVKAQLELELRVARRDNERAIQGQRAAVPCRNCGCERFSEIGGFFVCTCCGTIRRKDDERGAV